MELGLIAVAVVLRQGLINQTRLVLNSQSPARIVLFEKGLSLLKLLFNKKGSNKGGAGKRWPVDLSLWTVTAVAALSSEKGSCSRTVC